MIGGAFFVEWIGLALAVVETHGVLCLGEEKPADCKGSDDVGQDCD